MPPNASNGARSDGPRCTAALPRPSPTNPRPTTEPTGQSARASARRNRPLRSVKSAGWHLPRTVAITEPVSECLPGLRNAERIRRVDADVLPSAIGRPVDPVICPSTSRPAAPRPPATPRPNRPTGSNKSVRFPLRATPPLPVTRRRRWRSGQLFTRKNPADPIHPNVIGTWAWRRPITGLQARQSAEAPSRR